MNSILMEHIVQHVFANLGLIAVPYIQPQHVQTILDKNFKLHDKKLSFADGAKQVQRPVYGAQLNLVDKEFKIMAGDCSLDITSPEYCVVVQLTGLPAYGLYMICDPQLDPEALIAVTVNNKDWMPCSTFLQATVLAAMEQLRDVGMGWSKCTNYQELYNTLTTMIKFHSNYYEETNEGQEIRP
jgi:hypothetical protein